jgi:hypothetical protein
MYFIDRYAFYRQKQQYQQPAFQYHPISGKYEKIPLNPDSHP